MLKRIEFHNFVNSKDKLVGIILSISCLLVIIPFLIPHLQHKEMISHIVLHIVSFEIAIFLSLISLFAFLKRKGRRLFFMTMAFFSLSAIEIIYLYYAHENIRDIPIPYINIEFTHVFMLIILALFCLGIFRVGKNQ